MDIPARDGITFKNLITTFRMFQKNVIEFMDAGKRLPIHGRELREIGKIKKTIQIL